MNRTLAESHVAALRAFFGDDATDLEALSAGASMLLLVFAQAKIVQYVRKMLVRAALNPSSQPFDPTVLGKLVDADPVVQEAVVCYSSLDGATDIVYPDALGGCLVCAFDFRNASARLMSNIRKMERCFEWGPHLDACAVVRRSIHICIGSSLSSRSRFRLLSVVSLIALRVLVRIANVLLVLSLLLLLPLSLLLVALFGTRFS